MARKKYTDVERKIIKDISINLKRILNEKGLSQKDLADLSGLSTSVISDYLTEKTLATPGSIQLMADALNVKKTSIDSSLDQGNSELSRLPIIGRISCGNGSLAY